jgi:nicotinamide-nucleotide amidase
MGIETSMSTHIDTHLVSQLAQRLRQLNFNLSTAESCTGGGIGHWLTSISGSSVWYQGGFVTYSNLGKIRDLGVSLETLEREGAVSEAVAKQMVVGCAERAGTDAAIAVTGIAGPDGGTHEKPVGTVCFGWSVNGVARIETQVFKGDRSGVRAQSVVHAISQMIKFLDEPSN